MIFEIALNCLLCDKAETKNFLSMVSSLANRKKGRQSVIIIDFIRVNSCHAFICFILLSVSFCSTGEPAAGIGFTFKRKVDKEIRPGSAAAGSLGGWLLGSYLKCGHWRAVLGQSF